MKNRAKCKLCKDIIESFHETDYAKCKCDHISVYGGPQLMQCAAIDFDNFMRVDESGNEIVVVVQSNDDANTNTIDASKREELYNLILEMIKAIDNLPEHAMNSPITHYDYKFLLSVLSSALKLDLPEN